MNTACDHPRKYLVTQSGTSCIAEWYCPDCRARFPVEGHLHSIESVGGSIGGTG
ncbi:MAG: hypothetical protein PHI16_06910 [Methanocellales archaeon]|jgi:hypothetical protein|nr:hypothetical protein [Methanocellales archaeon]DBA35129.1 TPA_asm: hypothetical protein vir515_00044 [Caudoviricetes sp. vir515]